VSEFVRLPARRWGVLRRASIWDAGDYLLSVSGTSFTERYRRFYYRDIQAIVVQKGPRLGSIGAMLLTFLCTVALFRWYWQIPLLWLAWLVYANVWRSCRVFVYTAVSSEELPAIYRRRSAARVLPKILNKIAEAQGDFSADLAANVVRTIPDAALETAALPVSRQILYAVSLFSVLFIGSAAFAYWYRDAPLVPSSLLFAKILLPVINALEVAAGVWGIFKLLGNRMMNSLKICLFAGLVVLAVRSYSVLLVVSLMSQRNGVLNDTLSNVHLRYWIGTADCALSMVVAVAGLISLILAWQDDRQVPVSGL
jgi:hypothetical protein